MCMESKAGMTASIVKPKTLGENYASGPLHLHESQMNPAGIGHGSPRWEAGVFRMSIISCNFTPRLRLGFSSKIFARGLPAKLFFRPWFSPQVCI
jgi:hypothetical protein